MRKQFSKEQDYNLKTLAKDKTTQEFLDKCVSYIELHISNNNLHADDLCKELGLSKTLLYEKIKNITGLTVNEFIKVIRLKRSVEYLKEGKLNVSQIAIEVGFNSLSYFTRSFVKQYGKSPSEYLKV
jgi:AraC-like DNA-binding protein